jgi:RHS repeat-associated protein
LFGGTGKTENAQLQGVITGQISGGFGGVTETHSYNNRLEYTGTQASSSNGTALNLSLNYNLSGGNNGSVASITNNVDNGRTETLQYDPLNRILTAQSSATSGVDCWGQNFGPDGNAADDAVANLTAINSGTQTAPSCPFGRLSATVDGNNHINTDATYAYDAAGNMTQDGSGLTYTFDAENHITSAAGVTYTYDGNGLRVKKSNGTLYWRSIAGDAIAETDLSGNTISEYVFFAGRRVARLDASANVFYYFTDPLGNTRTITDATGHVCYDADFTPYGQEINHANTCPQNYKFTGYERDLETGNDYAFARFYNPRLGRFMTPDPLGGGLGDPQSLNRYAYVLNDPANLTDPSGLCGQDSRMRCKEAPKGFFDWNTDGGIPDWALFGLLGLANGDEFGLLQLAFAPTGPDYRVHNCEDPDEDCGNTWITPYANMGLLSLLGGGNSSLSANNGKCLSNVKTFVNQHLADAQNLAGQLGNGVTAQEVLATAPAP